MKRVFQNEGDQNAELVSDWKTKRDKESLDKIINNHYKLIRMLANKYVPMGFERDDLVAEGVIGLLMALEKFDEHKGAKFSTYAFYWIRAAILNFIKKVSLFTKERKVLKSSDPEKENISLSVPIFSLNRKLSGSDEEWEVFLQHKENLENTVQFSEYQRILKASLLSLGSKDRQIIEDRWLSNNTKTLEQIGKELSVSKECVRQMEKRAILNLKKAITQNFGSIRGMIDVVAMASFLRYVLFLETIV